MPDDEGHALYELASLAPVAQAHPVVEIGAWAGKSTLLLGEAARGRGIVLSIDHHHGSEENYPPFPYFDQRFADPQTGRLDTLVGLRRTLELGRLEEVVIPIVGSSPEFAAVTHINAAMVFIDGGHSALSCWLDYDAWVDRVIDGGILAIHDVFEDPRDGGRPPHAVATAVAHRADYTPLLRRGSLAAYRRRMA
jgi:predicted O-methyltransferase YrrM